MVTGRVLTPEGAPATDANVNIATQQRDYSTATSGYAKTAADGSYHISGLATGTYTVRVDSEKQAWVVEELKDIALTEGKETAIPDLHARIGAVLEGSVVDADTGMPIPGVFLTLYPGNTNINRISSASTDKNGHFFFRAFPEQMTLRCERPQCGYQRLLETDVLPVDLQEGKSLSVVVKLHKGLSVTGTVTDGEGKPVVGAYLSLWMPYNKDGEQSRNDTYVGFTSDQHGQFEVSGLPVGKGSITFQRNDQNTPAWEQPAPLDIEVPAKGPITVKLNRVILHSVTGRVLNEKGKPVAGQTFSLRIPYRNDGSQDRNDTQVQFTTDQHGKFTLSGLHAGLGAITLVHNKLGEWEQPSQQSVTIPAKEPIIINMKHVSFDDVVKGDAMLEGIVQDAETGTPLPGASVSLYHGNLPWGSCRADKDGHFSFHTQPAGVTLRIDNPPNGYQKMQNRDVITLELREGKTATVVLKMRKGLSVTGTVMDGEGKPISGVGFILWMPDNNRV